MRKKVIELGLLVGMAGLLSKEIVGGIVERFFVGPGDAGWVAALLSAIAMFYVLTRKKE